MVLRTAPSAPRKVHCCVLWAQSLWLQEYWHFPCFESVSITGSMGTRWLFAVTYMYWEHGAHVGIERVRDCGLCAFGGRGSLAAPYVPAEEMFSVLLGCPGEERRKPSMPSTSPLSLVCLSQGGGWPQASCGEEGGKTAVACYTAVPDCGGKKSRENQLDRSLC